MTIDLTSRYNIGRYMQGGPSAWALDRAAEPVRALMIHHTAGFYGQTLGIGATQAEEIEQLDALAADHAARFKIGPGYYYAAFPSGRLYAIGKYGTHRAHVKGRNPQTNNWWNRESLAIVAFGGYETNQMSGPLKAAIGAGITEIMGYVDDVPIYPHGETPGNPTQTSCPGKYVKAFLRGELPPANDEVIADLKQAQAALERALRRLEE